MLPIAICDDNMDELANMAQLINLYRISKNSHCKWTTFTKVIKEQYLNYQMEEV